MPSGKDTSSALGSAAANTCCDCRHVSPGSKRKSYFRPLWTCRITACPNPNSPPGTRKNCPRCGNWRRAKNSAHHCADSLCVLDSAAPVATAAGDAAPEFLEEFILGCALGAPLADLHCSSPSFISPAVRRIPPSHAPRQRVAAQRPRPSCWPTTRGPCSSSSGTACACGRSNRKTQTAVVSSSQTAS